MRIAAVLVVTLLAGCGSETGGTGASDTPDDRVRGTRAGGGTELTVVLAGTGSGRVTYSLTCEPAGGDHPDPEAACQGLAASEEPFAPVPDGEVCTEIYGGPQTARVTGTYGGEPVDARFDRTNGCEISRWDAHVDLLVDRGGAEGT